MRVLIAVSAQRELDRIGQWWREHREKAPELFDEELSDASALLARTPNLGREYARRGSRLIRWIVLPKTKVKLYYWANESAGFVRIVAARGGMRERPPRL